MEKISWENEFENRLYEDLERWADDNGYSLKYDEIEDLHCGFIEYQKTLYTHSSSHWDEIESMAYKLIEQYKYGAFENLYEN